MISWAPTPKGCEVEHENLRTALSWAIERGDANLGLRIAGALWWFWHVRGYSDEARRWLEEALAKRGWTSLTIRAKALDALGWVTYEQNDVKRAESAATEGLELSERAEMEASRLVSFQSLLGQVALIRGDNERAKELFEGNLTLSRGTGDKRDVAVALDGLAIFWLEQENYVQAKELYEKSIAVWRDLDAANYLANGLISMGYTMLLEGDAERAEALNEEAVALLRKQGNRVALPTALDNLGWATLLRGDYERARAFYEGSLGLSRELSQKDISAENLDGLACVAAASGEDERAARMFGAARALHESVGSHHTPAEQALREPYLITARSQLDKVSWESAFAEGRVMTFEEAVEYALSEGMPDPSTTPVPERAPTDKLTGNLTRREREVALLVVRGLTNRRISIELSISEHTAANHVAKILRKLGLRSRAQIAAHAEVIADAAEAKSGTAPGMAAPDG